MKKLLIMLLAIAFATPAQAMQSRPQPGSANNALATCVLSLIVIGLPLGCKGARLKNASTKATKTSVTIHKPEGGKCANGNTYRIMHYASDAEARYICKNSFHSGKSVPACTNSAGKNGNAHSLITLGPTNFWKAHEVHHACDVTWNH